MWTVFCLLVGFAWGWSACEKKDWFKTFDPIDSERLKIEAFFAQPK